MKKLPLHWKILIGILLGVAFGIIVSQINGGKHWINDWIAPFGNLFIKSLKLITVPLILASLIKGISDLKDISKFSSMGGRTVGLYLLTTVVAVVIGLVVVNTINPGKLITQESREDLMSSYSTQTSDRLKQADKQRESRPLQALEDIVPDNFFAAASNNSNMLQVIFFAVFIGITIILIPEEKTKPFTKFFDSFNTIILKMINLIMEFAPIGVFCLLANLIAQAPNGDVFQALGLYAITVVIGLLLMLIFYIFIVRIIAKKTPLLFFKAISPAQLLAFSTSSSAATLPVTKEQVEKELKVSEEVSSFVLPLGATINMDGTSLYQAVAAVFIAQAWGMDLDLSAQIGIIITAVLASIGSAAVPGAGIVMLVMVLAQAGIPEAGIGLIFAIDRPLDMCRTTINVTGDASICMIIDKYFKKSKSK